MRTTTFFVILITYFKAQKEELINKALKVLPYKDKPLRNLPINFDGMSV
jgi:hypothetical protein